MTTLSLPTVRTRFGYARTECGCDACTTNCRFLPGFLMPDDLPRLAGSKALSDVLAWAEAHLLASPGATALMGRKIVRIPTLVPARHPGQDACHWLTADGKCQVHRASPFGCAFFDCKDHDGRGDTLSGLALENLYLTWEARGDYARVWEHLYAKGLHAPEPGLLRRKMRAYLDTQPPVDDGNVR